MPDDQNTRLECDSCSAMHDCRVSHSSLDGATLCPACHADWMEEIAACGHVWKRSDHYEPGECSRSCDKCGAMEKISAEEAAKLDAEISHG